MGFVLYDGGYTGTFTEFKRQGLELRWDWDWEYSERLDRSGYRYALVITEGKSGLYYDFSTSEDGTAKPRSTYKVHKR